MTARPLMSTPSFPLVRVFEDSGDECYLAGESETTVDYLDHTAHLVACPVGSATIDTLLAAHEGGEILTDLDGWTLLSLPHAESG